jgi:predicted acyltransferase (DUF342 family)
MAFDRKTLVIPDYTKFEEKTIITKGDVIIGDRSLIQFGIKTDGRIFVGEHAIIDGDLEASKDVRIDIFTNIGGSVISNGNVYLGEKVKINGKLSLQGDLDVGDSVDIKNGFEAKGWINIRSPIPIVIYIFIYLTQLLKMGHSEDIDRILQEIEENDGDTIPISEIFLFIPNNSIIGIQKSKVDNNASIGKNSRLLGNFDIKGNVFIKEGSSIDGTLRTTGDVYCNKNVTILGNVNANGDLVVEDRSKVAGNISAEKIYLSKNALIDGMLFAKNGISFVNFSNEHAEEKITRFQSSSALYEDIDDLLE